MNRFKIFLLTTALLMSYTGFSFGQQTMTKLTLSWDSPVTRENGVPLTSAEIAGYEIVDSCRPDEVIEVTGLEYSFEVSLPYNCEFKILTVDSDGLRSAYSDVLSVEFNRPMPPTFNKLRVN